MALSSLLLLGPPDRELQNSISHHVQPSFWSSPHHLLLDQCSCLLLGLPAPALALYSLFPLRPSEKACANPCQVTCLPCSELSVAPVSLRAKLRSSLWPSSRCTVCFHLLSTLYPITLPLFLCGQTDLLAVPGELILASGPLYLLFYLPGMLFPQILHSSLSHFFSYFSLNATSSENSSKSVLFFSYFILYGTYHHLLLCYIFIFYNVDSFVL